MSQRFLSVMGTSGYEGGEILEISPISLGSLPIDRFSYFVRNFTGFAAGPRLFRYQLDLFVASPSSPCPVGFECCWNPNYSSGTGRLQTGVYYTCSWSST